MRVHVHLRVPLLVSLAVIGLAGPADAVRPAGWSHRAEPRRIAAGEGFTCVLLGDTTVKCWGVNDSGQLGLGTTGTPQRQPPTGVVRLPPPTGVVGLSVASNAITIAAGRAHACVVQTSGEVSCWGDNEFGQLGDSTTTDRPTAVVVRNASGIPVRTAIAIAAGEVHSCALLASGRVLCWGDGGSGQLGNGSTLGSLRAVPVSDLTDAVAIGAGAFHTCAVRVNGTVLCWGDNVAGELGNNETGTIEATPVEVDVDSLDDAVAVAGGFSFTCALRVTGTVRCWGNNESGQLGTGSASPTPSPLPQPVNNVNNATNLAIGAGANHACAQRVDGTLRCWGLNASGQVGDQSFTSPRPSQRTVFGLTNALAIGAGTFHSCALLANETMRCWGENGTGELGINLTIDQNSPATVIGIAGSISARLVEAGSSHTCAIRTDGTAACWGLNQNRQLGNDSTTSTGFPVPVRNLAGLAGNLSNLVAIAPGAFHTCALRADGNVFCWGSNGRLQLGAGGEGLDESGVPVAAGVTDAIALAGGSLHTCALRANGMVLCWGINGRGEIGNNSTTDVATPVSPQSLNGVVAISAGGRHTCAVRFNGQARCWGSNVRDQLGNTSATDPQLTPIAVSGLSNAVGIGASRFEAEGYSCAVLADGLMSCWGSNDLGQLGDGTTDPHPVPGTVPGLTNAVGAPAIGVTHTCVLRAFGIGQAHCWGDNAFDQLGSSAPDPTLTPRSVLGLAESVTAGNFHTCVKGTSRPLCQGANDQGQVGGSVGGQLPALAVVASFAFNVRPLGSLVGPGRAVTLVALAHCSAGAHVKIDITLRQGNVVGMGSANEKCTGGLAQYPVVVYPRGRGTFAQGPAVAEARAEVQDQGDVIDTPEWTRTVNLVP